jgi:hypothetical protein
VGVRHARRRQPMPARSTARMSSPTDYENTTFDADRPAKAREVPGWVSGLMRRAGRARREGNSTTGYAMLSA